MRSMAKEAGFEVTIDSAGTSGWHQGDPPDPRTRMAGEARGYDFTGQGARALTADDFHRFDVIAVMDRANLDAALDMATENAPCDVMRLLEFLLPADVMRLGMRTDADFDVPDPYYGGAQGFERVIDLIEAGCKGLLARLM